MNDEQNIYEVVSGYRGRLLNEVILLERAIDIYIARFFTNDEYKENLFYMLFLGDSRFSMENKKQVFQYIADNYDKEWYRSYQSIRNIKSEKNSAIMGKDLVYVIDMRNIIAHRLFIGEDGNESGEVHFLTFKNATKKIKVDRGVFTELMLVVKDLTDFLWTKLKK